MQEQRPATTTIRGQRPVAGVCSTLAGRPDESPAWVGGGGSSSTSWRWAIVCFYLLSPGHQPPAAPGKDKVLAWIANWRQLDQGPERAPLELAQNSCEIPQGFSRLFQEPQTPGQCTSRARSFSSTFQEAQEAEGGGIVSSPCHFQILTREEARE